LQSAAASSTGLQEAKTNSCKDKLCKVKHPEKKSCISSQHDRGSPGLSGSTKWSGYFLNLRKRPDTSLGLFAAGEKED